MAIGAYLITAAALIWTGMVGLPWRFWSTTPFLDAQSSAHQDTLGDITVLIPARNEAKVIERTLRALQKQGQDLKIVVVDDQSTDATRQLAIATGLPNLTVLKGEPVPAEWSGKLWALEQGRHHVHTPLTLLLDADIELDPSLLSTLKQALQQDNRPFISLLAAPSMASFWEKLLMPAFAYFFKWLYPFRLVNKPTSPAAAAAGGCILLQTRLLAEIGGFRAIREALIDDCTLAQRVKSLGHPIWLGLTHSARSQRPYQNLAEIGNMVARSAFTQLRYSLGLLILCTASMVICFAVPVLGLFHPDPSAELLSLATLLIMMASYMPILNFYGRSRAWALTLPLIGLLYLAMTWHSAIRYWRGERARWKERSYGKDAVLEPSAPDIVKPTID